MRLHRPIGLWACLKESHMAKTNNGKVVATANNIEFVELEDGRMAAVFDPKKSLGKSASGKSDLIASTNGNLSVSDFTAGINIYRKAK